MKTGTKNHVAGGLRKAKGTVKVAVPGSTQIPHSAAKIKAGSGTSKNREKNRQAGEVSGAAEASHPIRLVASASPKPRARMTSSIAQWSKSFGVWSKATLASLLRLAVRLFSFVGNAIWSSSIRRLYKQRSPQVA
jgi:hypothetical protein